MEPNGIASNATRPRKSSSPTRPSLGLAKAAFAHGDRAKAEHGFQTVLNRHPKSELTPEALYCAGVSRYKRTEIPQHCDRPPERSNRGTAILAGPKRPQFGQDRQVLSDSTGPAAFRSRTGNTRPL